MEGFEPSTPALRKRCSAVELHRRATQFYRAVFTNRNSTVPSVSSNPARAERPEGSTLFWHATGYWAKQIRGRMLYFGRGSHEDALAADLDQKDDLHAGRTPRDQEEIGRAHV